MDKRPFYLNLRLKLKFSAIELGGRSLNLRLKKYDMASAEGLGNRFLTALVGGEIAPNFRRLLCFFERFPSIWLLVGVSIHQRSTLDWAKVIEFSTLGQNLCFR